MNREFRADAMISNPVAYAHVHCAEALHIPVHFMFPQVPTRYHAAIAPVFRGHGLIN